MAGFGILVVQAEITLAHELETLRILSLFRHRDFSKAFLDLAAGQHFEAVGIDIIKEVLVRTVRIWVGKEIVIDSHLGVGTVVGVHPVDRCALDLASVGGVTAAAFR